MNEFWCLMAVPLGVCLVLSCLHAYLGFHIIERQVIFADLALAQMAVLGLGVSLAVGFSKDGLEAYAMSLVFALAGAFLLMWIRVNKAHVLQEAIIGIIYVVSSAALIMILSRSGQGDEYIRESLAGNVLLINQAEALKIFMLYALIGGLHYLFREQFLCLSQNPQQALKKGMNICWWDFLFYALFAIVVTSSVKIAGVLLVFAMLVVPPVCALMLSKNSSKRMWIGWGFGIGASVIGLAGSYWMDFPSGASVVCVFGFTFLLSCLLSSWKGNVFKQTALPHDQKPKPTEN